MKRISPLNAKGSAENNVCPFINKKNSSPRVLCLWFFLIAHSFFQKSNGFAVSMHFSPYAGAACAALFAAFFAAMTGLDPHTQVVIILLPSVVLNLEEDPVKQSGFVAVHQLWKNTVVLVDQSEAFAGSCFPVAFHQLIFCNAHVRTSIFFLGG